MFGGEETNVGRREKIIPGVLYDVPLVDLATDIAKTLCKTLDLKEGKSVGFFDKNVRREK